MLSLHRFLLLQRARPRCSAAADRRSPSWLGDGTPPASIQQRASRTARSHLFRPRMGPIAPANSERVRERARWPDTQVSELLLVICYSWRIAPGRAAGRNPLHKIAGQAFFIVRHSAGSVAEMFFFRRQKLFIPVLIDRFHDCFV